VPAPAACSTATAVASSARRRKRRNLWPAISCTHEQRRPDRADQ
jgi:hypothetical protein